MFSFKFTWFLWIVVPIKIHSGSPRWDEVVDSSLPSLPLSSRGWGRWLSPANYSRCLLGWIPSGCACEECTAFSASNLCFPGWPTMRSKEWGLTQSLCQVRLIQTQDLSSFLELADVQAAFPLPAAPGLLTAPHWSCAAFRRAVSKEKLLCNSHVCAVTSKPGCLSVFPLNFAMK